MMDLNPTTKVVVGVSGGVDSMVLADILHKRGQPLVVAHLNHGLRGAESDADEALVRAWAKERDIPFESEQVNLAPGGNLEAKGRKARYYFFEKVREKYSADWIAVAHHEDDQLETILMNEARGAGLRGLKGIDEMNGRVVRPLLGMKKADILDYAKKNGVVYREDASNADTRFTRNRLRHEVIPNMSEQDRRAVLDRAHAAREKLTDLQEQVSAWMENNWHDERFSRLNFTSMSKALQAEILIRILGAEDLYKPTIERLIHHIRHGENGKKVAAKRHEFWTEYEWIRVKKAEVKTTEWVLHNTSGLALSVRAWQLGDRFRPSGMTGTKKLQDYFVDMKVPRAERLTVPVVVNEVGEIVSVGGRFDEQFKELMESISVHPKTA